jgi:aspartyl-tRNA synthetase
MSENLTENMSENLYGMKRTAYCATFTENDIGRRVTVMGWVQKYRNLGGVLFVDLRDRSGILQLTFHSERNTALFEKASQIRNEYVIAATGVIAARGPKDINKNMVTGKIEVLCDELRILSKSETPPIYVDDRANTNEAARLKYRYLDLRRPEMQQALYMRHRIVQSAREFLNQNDFLEIETPILTKSTPEGARDYLVPSRVNPGTYYALPQSPQIYKQLLMVSGFDRYYQIARCFRDEDLRADRQPEFTQIDIEMSFVNTEDIMEVNERLIAKIFKDILNIEIPRPLPRMTYQEAMERFGSDKPNIGFGMELVNVSDIAAACDFKVFRSAVENGGSVRLINAKGCADKYSRKEIDALGEFVKTFNAKGLAWLAVGEDQHKSSFAKFLKPEETDAFIRKAQGEPGDLLFFIADSDNTVFDALGNLRLEVARKIGILEDIKDQFNLLWVTEFPLLEYDEEEKRYVAKHHPFTSPMDEDLHLLDTDPLKVRAKAYDLVLNGTELGGGSIRIHRTEMQNKMFELLGFSQEEAENRFGFLLEAFKYGTPPHGGIAFGLDRLVMLLTGRKSIRDVIAFPKVQNASCLMSGAPSKVDQKQLDELKIRNVE